MNAKKNKSEINKLEENAASSDRILSKQKGIDPEPVEFEAEFQTGYTPDEAQAEALRRIRLWWGK